jgi:hypothetical protein
MTTRPEAWSGSLKVLVPIVTTMRSDLVHVGWTCDFISAAVVIAAGMV